MDQIDIKISQIHKQEFKNLQSSQLILSLMGNTVNSTLVNTLRRLSIDYIPTYAFIPDSITIEKNTSIFNNDYMKLRLSQMTIPNIINKIYFLEDKYWKDINFKNPDRPRHPDDNRVLEIYINAYNNTNDIMNVTTEHTKVYEDGIELENKFDPQYPWLIIQLRPGEAFSSRCVTVLSIGMNNNIWAGAGNAYFKEIEDNQYQLIIESQGQMDEYEILHKGCRILKEKINITKKLIKDKYDSPIVADAQILKLELENEDHTLGGVINEYLQNNKNVLFSGLSKPNLLIDSMIIEFQTIKNNPLQFLNETLDYITKIFDEIELQIGNLGSEFIKYEKINKVDKVNMKNKK